MILPTLLTYLFVVRLYRVYEQTQNLIEDESKELVAIITKTSLLAFISIINTMFTSFMTALIQVFPNAHFWFVITVTASIDTFSNCVCIWLSYNQFNGYYTRICGCMDVKCHQLWNKCTEKKLADEVAMATVISDDPK